MNKIVNKILLAGDKLLFEIHLKRPGFTCSAYGPYKKTKKEQKNLKKQERYIHDTFIKTNLIKSAFSMLWSIRILTNHLED